MKNYTDEFSFVLKPSSIKDAGIGVFALHAIKSGTKLALNKDGGESRILEASEIPEGLKHFSIALPNGKRKAPKEFNHLWLVWYLNHSDNPNSELNEADNNYYAKKDVNEGDEILVDYNAFNDQPENKPNFH